MNSVSRRLVSATLLVALAAVPATALHASPADGEGAPASWTAAVLDSLAKWLGDRGPKPQERRPVAAASTTDPEPADNDARPWWDPNGVDALSSGETEARPWWDPNG